MRNTEKVYIGVDGGGTKTAIGVFDERWQCLAEAVCPPLNYHFFGVDAALANLRQGIEALNISAEQIAAVGIGDPSLDDVSEGEAAYRFAGAVREMLGVPVFIRSDAYMTLYALTQGKTPGVLVISGTGAMAIAEDALGSVSVAGGWGRLTGDEGSGYFIGLQALRAACHAADGIALPTELTEAALRYFDVESPRALIDVFYGEHEPDVAGFARIAAESAEAGDPQALEILCEAARYLADYTSVLICKSRADIVGVYGSVLCRNRIVRAEFEDLLKERHPGIDITEPPISAQCAAAMYAKAALEKERTV